MWLQSALLSLCVSKFNQSFHRNCPIIIPQFPSLRPSYWSFDKNMWETAVSSIVLECVSCHLINTHSTVRFSTPEAKQNATSFLHQVAIGAILSRKRTNRRILSPQWLSHPRCFANRAPLRRMRTAPSWLRCCCSAPSSLRSPWR